MRKPERDRLTLAAPTGVLSNGIFRDESVSNRREVLELAESDVTRLLRSAAGGDRHAYNRLLEAVYEELRRMAGARMRLERPDHTLQPTALVHEAYLRLVRGTQRWEGRAHFFGAAAEAMRRILVDHARRKKARKRGGEAERVTFTDLGVAAEQPDMDLLALDEALTALCKLDPRLGRVVQLRFFAGLNIEETAAVLGTSAATVKRDWTYARAWLYDHMMD